MNQYGQLARRFITSYFQVKWAVGGGMKGGFTIRRKTQLPYYLSGRDRKPKYEEQFDRRVAGCSMTPEWFTEIEAVLEI
jgi:hypothetical protein